MGIGNPRKGRTMKEVQETKQIRNIIDGLTETGLDAAGLHGVLSVMECAFSGDDPTEGTLEAAFFWLCRQVKRMEKEIDSACIELAAMKE